MTDQDKRERERIKTAVLGVIHAVTRLDRGFDQYNDRWEHVRRTRWECWEDSGSLAGLLRAVEVSVERLMGEIENICDI